MGSLGKESLMKEVKDIDEWKVILCSWVITITIVRMSSPSKVVDIFNVISIKILMIFFMETGGKKKPKIYKLLQ